MLASTLASIAYQTVTWVHMHCMCPQVKEFEDSSPRHAALLGFKACPRLKRRGGVIIHMTYRRVRATMSWHCAGTTVVLTSWSTPPPVGATTLNSFGTRQDYRQIFDRPVGKTCEPQTRPQGLPLPYPRAANAARGYVRGSKH